MNGATAKEQRRNLKKAVGEEAAAAVVACREDVQKLHFEHKALARQMLEFDRELAATKEGRAIDARRLGARLDEACERLDALSARYAEVHARLESTIRHFQIGENALRADIMRLEQWADARGALTRWQRFWSLLSGKCYVRLEPRLLEADQHYPKKGRAFATSDLGPIAREAFGVKQGAHLGAVEP